MHCLVTLWDGGGTVPAETGAVRRLVARGHTVTALGDPTPRSSPSAASPAPETYLPWVRRRLHWTAGDKLGITVDSGTAGCRPGPPGRRSGVRG